MDDFRREDTKVSRNGENCLQCQNSVMELGQICSYVPLQGLRMNIFVKQDEIIIRNCNGGRYLSFYANYFFSIKKCLRPKQYIYYLCVCVLRERERVNLSNVLTEPLHV